MATLVFGVMATILAMFVQRSLRVMTESSARATLNRTAIFIEADLRRDFESTSIAALSLPLNESTEDVVLGLQTVESISDQSTLRYSVTDYILYHWAKNEGTLERHVIASPSFALSANDPLRLDAGTLLSEASGSSRVSRRFAGIKGFEFKSDTAIEPPNIGLPIRLKLHLVLPKNDRFELRAESLFVPKGST